MKIVTTSEYEIFNEYSPEGNLIKKGVFTCYKNEEKLNKNIQQVSEMLKENKHFSLFEFSWYPILIKPLSQGSKFFEDVSEILKEFKVQKYLNCSSSEQGVIISGNGRAWNEYLKQNLSTNIISRSIYNFLHKVNPYLFDKVDSYENDKLWIQLLTKEQVQLEDRTLNELPFLEKKDDIQIHDWFAVKFFGVSYEMINRILRFRAMSFAQYDTRYTPMNDFKCMFGKDSVTKNSTDIKKIEDSLNSIQIAYNYLIGRGHKRDVIKQILPIGITTDILVAGNLKGWKNLFEQCTDEKAHWEIQVIMNDLKREMNEEFNYKF